MICFNDYLTSNVGGCASVSGALARAYLMPRSNIDYSIYHSDTEIDFTTKDILTGSGSVIPCFMDMDMPYKLAGETTRNDYGLTKTNKTIELFFAENTALTQKQILQLHNDEFVLIIFDNNSQRIIIGYERGLRFVSSSQEFSSTETHGGIVVTMTETNVNKPMLFVNYWDVVPVTGIWLWDDSILIPFGDFYDISYGVTPTGLASITGVYAIAENPAIVSIVDDNAGTLSIAGEAAGITNVKVFSKDGNYKAEITVTVTAV